MTELSKSPTVANKTSSYQNRMLCKYLFRSGAGWLAGTCQKSIRTIVAPSSASRKVCTGLRKQQNVNYCKKNSRHLSSKGSGNKNSSNSTETIDGQNAKMGYYLAAIGMLVFGVSYASVPLYKVFCQMTGFGAQPRLPKSLS